MALADRKDLRDGAILKDSPFWTVRKISANLVVSSAMVTSFIAACDYKWSFEASDLIQSRAR